MPVQMSITIPCLYKYIPKIKKKVVATAVSETSVSYILMFFKLREHCTEGTCPNVSQATGQAGYLMRTRCEHLKRCPVVEGQGPTFSVK